MLQNQIGKKTSGLENFFQLISLYYIPTGHKIGPQESGKDISCKEGEHEVHRVCAIRFGGPEGVERRVK